MASHRHQPETFEERRRRAIEEAEAHELADRLDEIEPTIRAADDSLWTCCMIAEIFKRRMLRMKAEGRMKQAEEAFAMSYAWMCDFASGATSGGEGAANSYARDQHLGVLESLLGYRPEGVKAWDEP